MFLTFLMLGVALSLSAIAAFYSIIGLTAIFAAAVVPVAIMGSILEIAKLTVTVWLHEYWHRCKRSMKIYLVPAVALLMLITSMGIFGFLSKAHLDQAVPAGDISAQVAIFDEKIRTQRDNIEAARTALRQMDAQVDQVLGRTTDDKGAERAVQIRRQQAGERNRLQQDISRAQAEIVKLNEQRAPIAAQARKVEAEVGPIKYIAALIYGDNPDQNLLEKAVRWVIIILVAVFDPLAIFMLLAATESYKWEKYGSRGDPEESKDPSPNSPVIDKIRIWQDKIKNWRSKNDADDNDGKPIAKDMDGQPDRNDAVVQSSSPVVDISPEQWGGQDLTANLRTAKNAWGETVYVDMPDIITPRPDVKYVGDADDEVIENKIDRASWQDHLAESLLIRPDLEEFKNVDFGIKFPDNPQKGDVFIRVDHLPTKLYKWNGLKWIEVDKNITDTFTYNDGYIDYLIAKIGSGEYDPDLLNPTEREQIQQRLRDDKDEFAPRS